MRYYKRIKNGDAYLNNASSDVKVRDLLNEVTQIL